MQCQDTSKLRTPLNEVCLSTDIGCVPIVSGKPNCNPQPDELPFAFDPSTNTLWIFGCKKREWIDFTKFNMCQLDALNLENITNICEILNIGVNYSGGGECRQGTVTLAELVEWIKECLKLETKIITIGEGDGNKVKISIDGLPNLPPVYVQGHNIWSEGGSGTEADPLVVATYDPICKWPTKTREQVDSADVKHLGACLDGEMVRVPYIDGEKPLCSLKRIGSDKVVRELSALAACVDGESVLIPLPDDFYTSKTPEYICVPLVTDAPSDPPAYGTGPIRLGCKGEIWFWICNEDRWVRYNPAIKHDFEDWNEQKKWIIDACENVKFHGWSEQGDCDIDFEISPYDLWKLLDECAGVCSSPYLTEAQVNAIVNNDPSRVRNVICVDGNTTITDYPVCCPTVYQAVSSTGGGACVAVGGGGAWVYSADEGRIVEGSAVVIQGGSTAPRFTVTNPFKYPALAHCTYTAAATVAGDGEGLEGGLLFVMNTEPTVNYRDMIALQNIGGVSLLTRQGQVFMPFEKGADVNVPFGEQGVLNPQSYARGYAGTYTKVIPARGTQTFYIHVFAIARTSPSTVVFHGGLFCDILLFNHVIS